MTVVCMKLLAYRDLFEKQELNIVKLSMKRRSMSATVDGSGQSASWQKCV